MKKTKPRQRWNDDREEDIKKVNASNWREIRSRAEWRRTSSTAMSFKMARKVEEDGGLTLKLPVLFMASLHLYSSFAFKVAKMSLYMCSSFTLQHIATLHLYSSFAFRVAQTSYSNFPSVQ